MDQSSSTDYYQCLIKIISELNNLFPIITKGHEFMQSGEGTYFDSKYKESQFGSMVKTYIFGSSFFKNCQKYSEYYTGKGYIDAVIVTSEEVFTFEFKYISPSYMRWINEDWREKIVEIKNQTKNIDKQFQLLDNFANLWRNHNSSTSSSHRKECNVEIRIFNPSVFVKLDKIIENPIFAGMNQKNQNYMDQMKSYKEQISKNSELMNKRKISSFLILGIFNEIHLYTMENDDSFVKLELNNEEENDLMGNFDRLSLKEKENDTKKEELVKLMENIKESQNALLTIQEEKLSMFLSTSKVLNESNNKKIEELISKVKKF